MRKRETYLLPGLILIPSCWQGFSTGRCSKHMYVSNCGESPQSSTKHVNHPRIPVEKVWRAGKTQLLSYLIHSRYPGLKTWVCQSHVTTMSSNKCVACLLDLPVQDILESQVFPHLSISDLFRLQQVSTRCAAIVSHYLSSSVHLLNLSENQTNKSQAVDSDQLLYLSVTCRKLVHLNLSHVRAGAGRGSELENFLRNNRDTVLSLDLSFTSAILSNNVTHHWDAFFVLQKLICLKLNGCYYLDCDVIQHLVSRCGQLEVLELDSCWSVIDDFLAYLGNHCKQLRRISLAKIYQITDRGIAAMVRSGGGGPQLDYLEAINLTGCWLITDSAIK